MDKSELLNFINGTRQVISFQDQHDLYDYIKAEYFQFKNYKWSIKKYNDFVKKNKLSHAECHSFLSKFSKSYFKFRNRNKLFKKFLLQIEKKIEIDLGSRINVNKGSEKEAICCFIKLLGDFTPYSKDKILKTTYSTIPTNLTWSSFRSYYYDGRFNCK